jgi:predicted GIY-YIG superfamily endonuclease
MTKETHSIPSWKWKIITCIIIVLGMQIVAYVWNSKTTNDVELLQHNKTVKNHVFFSDIQRSVKYSKIADITIGVRVLGTNPENSDVEHEFLGDEPNHKSHLGFYFIASKSDSSISFVHLLRPRNWLENETVEIREIYKDKDKQIQIWLDLPEMGITGWASLIGTNIIDEILPGEGNIVTGTFCHFVTETIALVVEDIGTIGTTSNHPFWSVDRKAFVEAGRLIEGERVQLYNGATKRVTQKLARPGPKLVYNLEVFGEHVYYVTPDGILVHNTCVYVNPTADDGIDYVGITNDFARRAAEHLRHNPLRHIVELEIGEQITRKKARALEQVLINRYRATLDNKINSIAPHRQNTNMQRRWNGQKKWRINWDFLHKNNNFFFSTVIFIF